jgi:S-(hydroxymethyl)glutathione dehydrogenase/alcohol dehydrogenase
MRAVILENFNAPLVVDDIDLLPLGPREVRVRVGASGVCHSDLSGARGFWATELPLIAGHEGAGTVEEVGRDVTRVRAGDRIIASFAPQCGHCYQCLRGRGQICEYEKSLVGIRRGRRNGHEIQATAALGTMAEVMTIDEASAVRVETDLPYDQLALIGCGVTTGVGAALWTADIQAGTSVAIFGCGGLGLSALQGAVIAGAAQIIAVDPVPAKREAALRLGATDVVDPFAADPVEQIRELTAGRGAEYTFEFAGLVDTMHQAYDAAAPGGTVTFVGALPPELTITFAANALHSQVKKVLGCRYGSAQVHRDMPLLVKLVEAGRLDVAGMVTRRLRLDDINEALAAIEAGEVIRSVLIP